MTRAAAVAIAREEAVRFGLTMVVYRFVAWPPDVYAVRAVSKLPSEAQQFERFEGSGPDAPVTPCELRDVSKNANKTPRTLCLPAAEQGSLF